MVEGGECFVVISQNYTSLFKGLVSEYRMCAFLCDECD